MTTLPRCRQPARRHLRRRLRHRRPGEEPHRRRLRRARARGLQRAARRSPGPTSSPSSTSKFFEVGVDVVETCTFGAFGAAARRVRHRRQGPRDQRRPPSIAREVADATRRPTSPASSPARWARAPSRPRSARSASPSCATSTRSRCDGLLEGGVDLLLIETHFDLLCVKASMIGARRAMAAVGREVPIQVQVTMETTGPHAARHRDRRRPRHPRRPAARHHRHQLRHRPGRDERAPPLPLASTPACRSRACPTPACRRWSTARCTTTSRPSSWPSTTSRLVTDLGISVIGGCCGTTPAHLKAVVDACADLEVAPRTVEHEPGATSIYSLVPVPAGHVVPDHRRAHQRQRLQEVPRGHARRRLGHLRADGQGPGQGGRPRPRRLRRLRRPRRHPRHGRDRPALRHPVQRPARARLHRARRSWRPALQWIGGRAILNSANLEDGERRGHPPRPRLHAGRASTAPPSSACSSTRRARPATSSGRCAVAHRIHDLAVEPLRPRAQRPHLRRADLPALHRRRRPAQGRHGHHRGHQAHQGRDPRGVHHARPLQRVLRPQAGRPPRPQLGVPARVRAGRPRLGHRARGPHHAAQQDPRGAARRSASTSSTTAASDGYDPLQKLLEVFADVNAAEVVKEDRSDWTDREASCRPAHHRRRPRRPRRRPRRGPGRGLHAAGHHQRRAPRGHEGRRRAVRQRARCSCRSCCSRPRR